MFYFSQILKLWKQEGMTESSNLKNRQVIKRMLFNRCFRFTDFLSGISYFKKLRGYHFFFICVKCPRLNVHADVEGNDVEGISFSYQNTLFPC